MICTVACFSIIYKVGCKFCLSKIVKVCTLQIGYDTCRHCLLIGLTEADQVYNM